MSNITYFDGTPVRVGDFFESDRNRRFIFKVHSIEDIPSERGVFYITYYLDKVTPYSFAPRFVSVLENGTLRAGLKKYKKPSRKSGFGEFVKEKGL